VGITRLFGRLGCREPRSTDNWSLSALFLMLFLKDMLRKDVHIGSMIRAIFLKRKKERNLTVDQFARALGCDRGRIYPLFRSKSIDTDLLVKISIILDHHFLLEYLEDNPSVIYFVFAEVDSLKMSEMIVDPSIKIIKTWKSVVNSQQKCCKFATK